MNTLIHSPYINYLFFNKKINECKIRKCNKMTNLLFKYLFLLGLYRMINDEIIIGRSHQGEAVKAKPSRRISQGESIKAKPSRRISQGVVVKAIQSRRGRQGDSVKAIQSRRGRQGDSVKAWSSRRFSQGVAVKAI